MLRKKLYQCGRRAVFLLTCLAVLSVFSACRKEPSVADATPSSWPLLSATPEPTPLPRPTSTLEATPEPTPLEVLQKSEEELCRLLKTEYGFSVIHSEYNDFDQNGTYEMFALVLETELLEQYAEEEWLYGKIIYLSGDAAFWELTMPFYIWDTSSIRLEQLGDRLFFVADEAFVSETVSRVYTVYEDKPQCVMSGIGYFFAQDSTAFVNVSSYDMYVEPDGFSTGHTWKNYYFYYDEESRCFTEYLARQITEEEFLAFSGTELLLEELKQRYGADAEFEFLYRENGVLHVNIFYQEMGATVQKNCSAHLKDGVPGEWEENEGRYRLSGTEGEEWE